MNYIRKSAIALFILGCAYFFLSSHFIWIETEGTALAGKRHAVNIFFGEVNFSQREVTGGRLDEMDSVKVICIDPDKGITPLVLRKQQDRFVTAFDPSKPGIYQVLSSNEAAAVMDLRKSSLGIVKPMYYARQVVLCAGSKDASPSAAMQPYFALDLVPDFSTSKKNTFSVNRPLRFHSYFNREPVKGGKIFAHAPNGWSKEINADVEGLCTFTPLWEGQYVIDWVYTENAPGTWRGKNYESVRHRAVLTLHVAK
jgi:hypothetical protein